MEIVNQIKKLGVTDVKTFMGWKFNTLKKSENRDVNNLKNSILKYGFIDPIILWEQENFVMNGTGRKQAIQELINDGHTIKEIPYLSVSANDYEEAKQKALSLSSSFGFITQESFDDFTSKIVVDFDTIQLDGIAPKVSNDSIPATTTLALRKITFGLLDDQLEIVRNMLEDIKGSLEYEEMAKETQNKNRNGNALYILAKRYFNGKIQ